MKAGSYDEFKNNINGGYLCVTGVWSRFKECPRDLFICGIDTRVDDPGGDDKGLSDIKHLCCKPIFVKKKKKAHGSKLKKRR